MSTEKKRALQEFLSRTIGRSTWGIFVILRRSRRIWPSNWTFLSLAARSFTALRYVQDDRNGERTRGRLHKAFAAQNKAGQATVWVPGP